MKYTATQKLVLLIIDSLGDAVVSGLARNYVYGGNPSAEGARIEGLEAPKPPNGVRSRKGVASPAPTTNAFSAYSMPQNASRTK